MRSLCSEVFDNWLTTFVTVLSQSVSIQPTSANEFIPTMSQWCPNLNLFKLHRAVVLDRVFMLFAFLYSAAKQSINLNLSLSVLFHVFVSINLRISTSVPVLPDPSTLTPSSCHPEAAVHQQVTVLFYLSINILEHFSPICPCPFPCLFPSLTEYSIPLMSCCPLPVYPPTVPSLTLFLYSSQISLSSLSQCSLLSLSILLPLVHLRCHAPGHHFKNHTGALSVHSSTLP